MSLVSCSQLFWRQIERLLAQRHGHQASPAFAQQVERARCIAHLGGRISRFRKQRASLGDHLPRLVLVEPLAKQEQEGVPCARINRTRRTPIVLVEQALAQQLPRPEMVAGKGLAGEDGQRVLVGLDRRLQIVGLGALDAIAVGDREIVLGLRPVLREGLAGPDGQRRLVGLDRRLQIVGLGALDAIAVGGREIVLRLRPVLREGLAGEDGQRRPHRP